MSRADAKRAPPLPLRHELSNPPPPKPALQLGLSLELRLRLNRLKGATQNQYLRALARFERWADATGRPVAQNALELDAQLVEFALSVFTTKDGGGRQLAVAARLACEWLTPELKGRLRRSAAVTGLATWNRTAGRVVDSHRPITWPLLCVAASRMVRAGHRAVAVAAVVAFHGLLRISEVAALSLEDVAEQQLAAADLPAGLVVSIRNPKTSSRDGLHQSVVVTDAVAVGLLREWVQERRARAGPRASLFGQSVQQLGAKFCAAAGGLGCRVRFTWHSLRHGGATARLMRGEAAADIMTAGRWRSESSLKIYLNAGRAVVAAHGAPPWVVEAGRQLAAALANAYPQ